MMIIRKWMICFCVLLFSTFKFGMHNFFQNTNFLHIFICNFSFHKTVTVINNKFFYANTYLTADEISETSGGRRCCIFNFLIGVENFLLTWSGAEPDSVSLSVESLNCKIRQIRKSYSRTWNFKVFWQTFCMFYMQKSFKNR